MNLMVNEQHPMTKKDKIIYVFALLGISCFGGGCFWWYWELYFFQLQNPAKELTGDPLYFMSILFGSSIFLMVLAGIFSLINLLLCIKNKTIFKLIHFINRGLFRNVVVLLAVIGGGFAFVSNIILLHKIIPENGYVLCPKKIGYKKNLLRDYVLDISQCERF